jgi:hypothetical protein
VDAVERPRGVKGRGSVVERCLFSGGADVGTWGAVPSEIRPSEGGPRSGEDASLERELERGEAQLAPAKVARCPRWLWPLREPPPTATTTGRAFSTLLQHAPLRPYFGPHLGRKNRRDFASLRPPFATSIRPRPLGSPINSAPPTIHRSNFSDLSPATASISYDINSAIAYDINLAANTSPTSSSAPSQPSGAPAATAWPSSSRCATPLAGHRPHRADQPDLQGDRLPSRLARRQLPPVGSLLRRLRRLVQPRSAAQRLRRQDTRRGLFRQAKASSAPRPRIVLRGPPQLVQIR